MSASKDIVKMNKTENWESEFKLNESIAPEVNIYETENDFFVIAFVPGVKRDLIKVRIQNDKLVIKAKLNTDENSDVEFIHKEREIGNYYRELRLNESVNQEKIEAVYSEGILTVKLAKSENSKPRNIEIE